VSVARFSVAYASSEGRTRVVVDHLADAMRDRDHQVTVDDVGTPHAADALRLADAVVLAGSIHGGRLQPRLVRFASAHGVALSERPSALMIVSMSAASSDAAVRARQQAYLDTFLAATPWRPDVVEFVAGALRPAALGPWRRAQAARVARQVGVDPKGEVDFTDWSSVTRFAESLARWFPRVGVPIRAPGRQEPMRVEHLRW
jgi:menaquinone-dependent protoporphyrinogen oxidase